MPFDGSGNFNRVMNWVSDALAGIKIRSDRHDQEDDNFAAGLSNTLTKDGQSQPTANIPMNGKRLVNLAAPVDPTDAATKAYADSIRNFNTAISLTGAVPQARIGFTQADIGFGARIAGTPAGSLSRWVWNTAPDLSGTDVMVLNDTGALETPVTLAGTSTGVSPAFVSKAMVGFTEADLSLVARKADPAATPPTQNRVVISDRADGTGTALLTVNEDGTVFGASNVKQTVVTTSGTYTKPAGLKFLEVWAIGGGGGSTQAVTTGAGQGSGGSGGGGGGAARKLYAAADLAATTSYTIGAGGTAPTGVGLAGGTTLFSGLSAGGGIGGGSTMAATATLGLWSGNAAGGAATGGDLNVPGGRAQTAIANPHGGAGRAMQGGGGASMFAQAIQPGVTNTTLAANAGPFPGGGATGGANGASQAGGTSSANGGDGCLMFKEYF